MGILDPILSFLLGPTDPPAKDPLFAAGAVVKRAFPDLERSRRAEISRLACLDEVSETFQDMDIDTTTAATLREGGAWSSRFVTGRHLDRGVSIRTVDMASEYAALHAEPIAA